MKKNIIFKAICVTLVVVFSFENILWANPIYTLQTPTPFQSLRDAEFTLRAALRYIRDGACEEIGIKFENIKVWPNFKIKGMSCAINFKDKKIAKNGDFIIDFVVDKKQYKAVMDPKKGGHIDIYEAEEFNEAILVESSGGESEAAPRVESISTKSEELLAEILAKIEQKAGEGVTEIEAVNESRLDGSVITFTIEEARRHAKSFQLFLRDENFYFFGGGRFNADAQTSSKQGKKIEKLRRAITKKLPNLQEDSLTDSRLHSLLELDKKSLNQAEVQRVLRRGTAGKRARNDIVGIIRQVQKPWSRRAFLLFLILVVPVIGVIYYLFFYKDSQDWTEAYSEIETKKADLNQKLTQEFLAAYPDERDFIKQINSNQDIVFANYAAEVYKHMMNVPKNKWEIQRAVDNFRNYPDILMNMHSTPETFRHVKRIVRNNRIIGLIEKLMQCYDMEQPDNDLNDFAKMTIDYIALRSATRALNIIHLGRKQGGLARRLAYYGKPKSRVSTSEYAYVDLATGTNFENYLQDILEYSPNRPILLTDISPYVIRFWHTLSQTLKLDNIQILDLDIRTMSRKTIPQKVGTIRLQNVATWVKDLSEEWVEQIFDLIEPGGQVILVQPVESLPQEGGTLPQPMGLTELIEVVALQGKDNAKLMLNFIEVVQRQEGKWNVFAGHVGEDGRFNQNQSGYIIKVSQGVGPKVYETVVVFQKIPQVRSGSSKHEADDSKKQLFAQKPQESNKPSNLEANKPPDKINKGDNIKSGIVAASLAANAYPYFKDLRVEEDLVDNMINTLASISFPGKKVVLAFHENLAGIESGMIPPLLRKLNGLKDREDLQIFLKDVVVIPSFNTDGVSEDDLSYQLEQCGIDPNSAKDVVFTFSPTDAKVSVAGKAIQKVAINEQNEDGKKFDSLSYTYPILPMVTIALVKYRYGFNSKKIREILKELGKIEDLAELNINTIEDGKEGAFLIFTLLERIKRYDTGQIDSYRRLMRAIDSAA